jgi:hypothetical protein
MNDLKDRAVASLDGENEMMQPEVNTVTIALE